MTPVNPTVRMASASYSVSEGAGTLTVTAELDVAARQGQVVTVQYATADVSARSPYDYIEVSGTLTFASGEVTKSQTITIVDDLVRETNETLTFTLSNPTNATLGTPSAATITVTDNDSDRLPEVYLTSATLEVDEGDGVAQVEVALSAGLNTGEVVTVDYATRDGTAADSDDYLGKFGTLQFTGGSGIQTQTINVPILEDKLVEGSENLFFRLSNASGATLGSPDESEIAIEDNDSTNPYLAVIEFPKPRKYVSEDDGTITIVIGRSGNTSSNVTVDYSTGNSTAIAGSDYTSTSGTVTIPSGETEGSFTVSITSDSVLEPPETFLVTLSNPTTDTGTVEIGGVKEVPVIITDPIIVTPKSYPEPEECSCTSIYLRVVRNETQSQGVDLRNKGSDPVRYTDGTMDIRAVDLASTIMDAPWGHARSWSNSVGYTVRTIQGNGWVTSQVPFLVKAGTNSYALIESGTNSRIFDESGGVFTARFYDPTKMTYDSSAGEFVITDTSGNQTRYKDFSTSRPVMERGSFQSIQTPSGILVTVTSRATDGRILEVQQQGTVNGQTVTESFVYQYGNHGANAWLLDAVTLRRKLGSGSWGVVREVKYVYYANGDTNGRAGDLKLAAILDPSGRVLGMYHYRYYTSDSSTGFKGALKYAFSPESYARLVRGVGNPDTASDSSVSTYADNYFEYDSARRVTKEVAQGAGCSACTGGQGTFTYSYTESTNSPGYNSWAVKTIETLPDSSTRKVYTNSYGQVMLIVRRESGGSQDWIEYNKYDTAGRRILSASPSAVSGYSDTFADLVHFQSGNAEYLRDSSGLISNLAYGTSTTATSSTAGDVLGYWKSASVQMGETGTQVKQADWTYLERTAGGVTVYDVAAETQYRNTDGSGGQTVNHSYNYFTDSTRAQQETITYPTVTTAQNGSNSATSDLVVYDLYGRPVWIKDADGFIHYLEYDPLTGAIVKEIADVNTSTTSDFTGLPSGWSTPTGGGLHLKTTYEVDNQGRPTKITYPNGRIDYAVYLDHLHEVRYYRAWNSTTNVPTEPTLVVRTDMAAGYTETLTMTATPTVGGGRPTGLEVVSSIQTLSRDYVNAAGQVVSSDVYFSLTGLTYSAAATLGTENTHFYRTRYVYDNHGLLNKVVSPAGTIYRVVHDFLGRPVSKWVGTDDTPTTGFWSPTNTAGTDLVKVWDGEYDNAGVGDGLLTKSTEILQSPYANRVAALAYDWRGRLVAAKLGVESSESTSLNRPINYVELDNLGHVVATETYDGDTLGITTDANSDGVPDRPSSSALRSKSTAGFDELGRVYQTNTYSVDPSSGSVSSNSLVSKVWHNARGIPMKTSSPGGLVDKYEFDGVGRTTKSYLTDGGGDSGYGDADDVTSDNVLAQTEWTYDSNSNPIFVTMRERFHDETGTGALGTPSSGVHARVSYGANYFDLADRLTDMVNVGTNGGSSYTRPSSVPSRSDTVLVTSYGYNLAGWASDVTDPKGLLGKSYFDLAGRVTKVIENYVNGTVSDTDDKTVEFDYGPAGRTRVRAQLTGGGQEQTEYVYGIGTSGGLFSNDIVGAVKYPDPSTGSPSSSEQESFTFNQIGEVQTATDRNGNVHTYYRDVLGRLTSDTVTTLGSGVDGAIRRLDIDYNTQGLPYLFTSYDSGSTVVNQVQRDFNGLGQLIAEYQAMNGSVNTSTTPKVEYAYSEMASGANHSRLTDLIYPNGRNLDYNYASGLNDTISRLSSITDGSTTLEGYDYLGTGTVVKRAHPEPGVDLTYVKLSGESNGDAGDPYTGLDRFGRVVDQRWTTSGGTTKDRFQYGYDRDSNPLYKENLSDATRSELFTYDGLNQLTTFARGTLNSTKDAISGTPSRSQSWDFDALGNFDSQTTDGSTQSRTHNKQNELLTATSQTSPTYDANGNQTKDFADRRFTFDAWNRLVKVDDAGGSPTLRTYEYDALNRRIQETAGGTTTDLYYSAGWQVLEERVSGNAKVSYAWSPVYVDALIARDRDTDANGSLDERLYALHDANANVTALVNTSGTVVERYLEDPFGTPTYFDASYASRSSSSYGWNYLHQGLRWDGTTGKFWNRRRDFDPAQGRFVENDPKGFGAGDVNLYRYEGNGPTEGLDPSGLDDNEWSFKKAGKWLLRNKVEIEVSIATTFADGTVAMWKQNAEMMNKVGSGDLGGAVNSETSYLAGMAREGLRHNSLVGTLILDDALKDIADLDPAAGDRGQKAEPVVETVATLAIPGAPAGAAGRVTGRAGATAAARATVCRQGATTTTRLETATLEWGSARTGRTAIDPVVEINRNADLATEMARRAQARGRLNGSPQHFGDYAHDRFAQLNERLNRRLVETGSSCRVAAEEFRFGNGRISDVPRAKGTIGADAVIRRIDDPSYIEIFDLKTHGGTPRPISESRQSEFTNRFGARAQEIYRQR